MTATPQLLGKKAHHTTLVYSIVHPVAIQFLLAPFAYLTGLLTGTEILGVVADIRLFGLLASTLAFAVILQHRTWVGFDRELQVCTDKRAAEKLLTAHLLATFINFFLIACWQICAALIGFKFCIHMTFENMYIYIPLGMSAFGMMLGSVLLTEIFTATETYFDSLNPEYLDAKPISLKILIMVAGLLCGTVILFVTANSWGRQLQVMGRVPPLPPTLSNIIMAITSSCFMVYVLFRLMTETNTLFSGLTTSLARVREKEKEEEYLKKQMELSVTRFKRLFANLQSAVENKDYSRRITPDSEYDDLALSLNDILETLEQAEIVRADQNWFKTGSTELSRIITGKQNMYHLTSQALQFIADYCQAATGTLFVLNEKTREYALAAVHALKRGEAFTPRFKSGQGIAGQAVKLQKTLVLTDIPDDYVYIESSFILGSPHCLIIVPLINEDLVVGVLELGSLETFSQRQIDFLEAASQNLAMAINAILLDQQFSNLAEAMDRRKATRKIP